MFENLFGTLPQRSVFPLHALGSSLVAHRLHTTNQRGAQGLRHVLPMHARGMNFRAVVYAPEILQECRHLHRLG